MGRLALFAFLAVGCATKTADDTPLDAGEPLDGGNHSFDGGSDSVDAGDTDAGMKMCVVLPGEPPIEYFGGRILTTPPNIYVIWLGSWSPSDVAPAAFPGFIAALSGSPLFSITALYTNAQGEHATDRLHLAKVIYKTVPDPATYDINSQKVAEVIADAVSSGELPKDENGIYLLLTSPDVAGPPSGRYSGLHFSARLGGTNLLMVWVGSKCILYQSISPSGDEASDCLAEIVTHELTETITDPYGRGWYDSAGNENADKCQGYEGEELFFTDAGARYNVTLDGRHFLMSGNWVPGCGCAMSP